MLAMWMGIGWGLDKDWIRIRIGLRLDGGRPKLGFAVRFEVNSGTALGLRSFLLQL